MHFFSRNWDIHIYNYFCKINNFFVFIIVALRKRRKYKGNVGILNLINLVNTKSGSYRFNLLKKNTNIVFVYYICVVINYGQMLFHSFCIIERLQFAKIHFYIITPS